MSKNISSPKTKYSLVRKTLTLIFLISTSFSIGYIFGLSGFKTSVSQFPKVTISREAPADKQTLDFLLFWRVWDTLQAKYFDRTKLIDANLVYGAIRGMVASIGDPYTVFLPPKENKVVQEDLQGNFEGVGIQIGFKGSQLAVIAPLPASPAEKAGIKAGDLIIGIKDELKDIDIDTAGITLPEAVQIIRGPAGTTVILSIFREELDDSLEIEIVRDSIDVPSIVVEYYPLTSDFMEDSSQVDKEEEQIAHVKILKFSGETLDEWEEVVIDLLKTSRLKGIIIDVRNNPGGFLQGAVELSSDFLESGEVIVIEEDNHGSRQEFRVEKLGRLRNIDVVILINEGSASASEIFAGALRDNKGVILVGETTFGKGTIQEPQQLNGDLNSPAEQVGLHVTIAKWLTPSGFWVDEGGLKPDVEIVDNDETEEDEQLQKAVSLLENGELEI
jgi:carboxyl-terminal processing protease